MEQLSIYNPRPGTKTWQLSDEVWADVTFDAATRIITLAAVTIRDSIQTSAPYTRAVSPASILKVGGKWYTVQALVADPFNGFFNATAEAMDSAPSIYNGGSILTDSASNVLQDSFENVIKVS